MNKAVDTTRSFTKFSCSTVAFNEAVIQSNVLNATPTEPQYRTLTVLFCDLVDSTKLSLQLSSQDLRETMLEYYARCSAVVEQNEGIVLRYVGDCVLAVFGYPLDSEADAENAAYSGLRIVDSLMRLNEEQTLCARSQLNVRITAATGQVITDDLIGSGPAQQTGVFGYIPYLAARLKNVTIPNTVVVTSETRGLLTNRFETEDLGFSHLRGFSNPIQAWRIVDKIENV